MPHCQIIVTLKTMLITFEGIEGSGKSTQVMLLEEFLKKEGMPYLILREPGGTKVSEIIRSILLDPQLHIEAETELFLFLASRAELVKKIIKPALAKKQIVICDRFIDSTIAYQSFGRGLPKDIIVLLNNLLISDITIKRTYLLDCNIHTMEQRNKNKIKDRIENAHISFHEKVRKGFLELAIQFPDRILVIDATLPPEEIHKIILKDFLTLL